MRTLWFRLSLSLLELWEWKMERNGKRQESQVQSNCKASLWEWETLKMGKKLESF